MVKRVLFDKLVALRDDAILLVREHWPAGRDRMLALHHLEQFFRYAGQALQDAGDE